MNWFRNIFDRVVEEFKYRKKMKKLKKNSPFIYF